jgi:hypothetical protein
MKHVSGFLSKWQQIDPVAELTIFAGPHKQWSYKKNTAPTTPLQVKNCVHAFYNKGKNSEIVLNTTIEITSNTSFWTINKRIQDIQGFLRPKKIEVHMIPLDMLQEVAICILTETSISLKHKKDNICAELRSLCNIPDTIPLGIHELKQGQRYGTPNNRYQVESSALTIYTDKRHVDDVKELCNMHIQTCTKNRLGLPPNITMIPCQPTLEIPAKIHERLIIKHNKCFHSLTQGTIAGLSWSKATKQLPITSISQFATSRPDIQTIIIIELIGMIKKRKPTQSTP